MMCSIIKMSPGSKRCSVYRATDKAGKCAKPIFHQKACLRWLPNVPNVKYITLVGARIELTVIRTCIGLIGSRFGSVRLFRYQHVSVSVTQKSRKPIRVLVEYRL